MKYAMPLSQVGRTSLLGPRRQRRSSRYVNLKYRINSFLRLVYLDV